MRSLGYSFDTSDLSAAALRAWIKDFISVDPSRLTLLFQSFGFKHGVPLDADLVFDVRCLPNPHYEPDLRAPRPAWIPKSSRISSGSPKPSACTTTSTISSTSWLPDYARDNRNYLTVAIGCTGGQHRSVYLVERLARAFARSIPGADPASRTGLTGVAASLR